MWLIPSVLSQMSQNALCLKKSLRPIALWWIIFSKIYGLYENRGTNLSVLIVPRHLEYLSGSNEKPFFNNVSSIRVEQRLVEALVLPPISLRMSEASGPHFKKWNRTIIQIIFDHILEKKWNRSCSISLRWLLMCHFYSLTQENKWWDKRAHRRCL